MVTLVDKNLQWKRVFIALKILFGVSLFAYILIYKFDFGVFADIKFLWAWFVLMLANSTLIAFLRVKKWDILLVNFFKQKYRFGKNWKTIMVGQFFAFFTPSRLGDFIRINYTKKELGYKKSFLAVLIDRIVDLAIMAFLALSGLIYFRHEFVDMIQSLLGITFLILVAAIITVFLMKNKLMKFYRPMKRLMGNINIGKSISFLIIAFLVWVLTFSQFFFAFRVIGEEYSFIPVFLIASISMVAIMLPISVNGIGIREFVAITMFPLVVMDGERAVVALWIVMLANSVYPALLGFVSFARD